MKKSVPLLCSAFALALSVLPAHAVLIGNMEMLTRRTYTSSGSTTMTTSSLSVTPDALRAISVAIHTARIVPNNGLPSIAGDYERFFADLASAKEKGLQVVIWSDAIALDLGRGNLEESDLAKILVRLPELLGKPKGSGAKEPSRAGADADGAPPALEMAGTGIAAGLAAALAPGMNLGILGPLQASLTTNRSINSVHEPFLPRMGVISLGAAYAYVPYNRFEDREVHDAPRSGLLLLDGQYSVRNDLAFGVTLPFAVNVPTIDGTTHSGKSDMSLRLAYWPGAGAAIRKAFLGFEGSLRLNTGDPAKATGLGASFVRLDVKTAYGAQSQRFRLHSRLGIESNLDGPDGLASTDVTFGGLLNGATAKSSLWNWAVHADLTWTRLSAHDLQRFEDEDGEHRALVRTMWEGRTGLTLLRVGKLGSRAARYTFQIEGIRRLDHDGYWSTTALQLAYGIQM